MDGRTGRSDGGVESAASMFDNVKLYCLILRSSFKSDFPPGHTLASMLCWDEDTDDSMSNKGVAPGSSSPVEKDHTSEMSSCITLLTTVLRANDL